MARTWLPDAHMWQVTRRGFSHTNYTCTWSSRQSVKNAKNSACRLLKCTMNQHWDTMIYVGHITGLYRAIIWNKFYQEMASLVKIFILESLLRPLLTDTIVMTATLSRDRYPPPFWLPRSQNGDHHDSYDPLPCCTLWTKLIDSASSIRVHSTEISTTYKPLSELSLKQTVAKRT